MKNPKVHVHRLFVIGLFLAGGASALAQVTASISGKIEDPSGAAVPEATITVTSQETRFQRTAVSDQAGVYRVLSVPVGVYLVKAEKVGFASRIQTGINLVVGQQAVVDFELEVGEVQQQVTVSGEAPLVNTTTASISGLVGERQVKDLPLNGRSFDNLITLNTGAVNYTSMKSAPSNGAGNGNYFSVAGRRPMENLLLLNGVEYTGASVVGVNPGGVSGQLLGIDAVREFNVVSGSYSVEYGKRAGAQVSVVTQSGTNNVHASAFEFLRNSALDARNFFDKGRVPPFKRNQFGGSLGAPIQKDKTFSFGSYEGFRQRLGISSAMLVPDLNARRGLLPDATGALVPVPNLNPAILPYLAYWPEPNGPMLGQGIAFSYSNPKQSIREDFATTRLDHTISSQDTLSAVYTLDDGDNLTPLVDPLFGSNITLRAQVASLQETHIFTPGIINTLTVGFSRAAFMLNTVPIGSFPAHLSFVSGAGAGTLIIGSGGATTAAAITPGGGPNSPFFQMARSLFTYQDGIQIIKGSHQISGGVWLQSLRQNENGVTASRGQASFPSLQSFFQGNVGTFTVVPNPIPRGWRSFQGAWYLQDSIHARSNLTVDLGLRHEFTNGWNESTNRAANFVTDSNGVLLTKTITGHSALTENNAKRLFGPRMAVAWDPFGNGKTSIRTGWGIYHNLLDSLSFKLKNVPPYTGQVSFQNVPFFSLIPVIPSIPTPPVCGPGVAAPCTTYQPNGVQANIKTSSVQSWNFTIEQQLMRDTALRVAYVGSRALHEIVGGDLNSIPARICSDSGGCISGGVGAARGFVSQGVEYIPVGTRPNPYLAGGGIVFLSLGNGSYNALQLELTRRLARGLQFRGSYTWSKNLDSGSAVSSSQAQNQPQVILNRLNPRLDWGRAAMDITHQASGSFSYVLPFGPNRHWLPGDGLAGKLAGGWQVNGIVTLLSGFPFTPVVGTNRSGDGNNNSPDRPSWNPAFSGTVALGSPNGWFSPKAFVLPTVGTFGNMARGALRGPGMAELDFSLFKSIAISERLDLQFRGEFFNFTNRSNFGTPNPVVFSGSNYNSSAGVITTTATTSRQIQFGLKLIF